MFSRILVPVDLSDRNDPAVEAAEDLAGDARGTVVLLHVIEELEDVDGDEVEAFYEGLRTRANATLSRLQGRLEERGVSVQARVRMGKRGAEIVRCSQEERCDLIVLRSHVLDPQNPVRGIGTISHQVALAAGCAVLLVR